MFRNAALQEGVQFVRRDFKTHHVLTSIKTYTKKCQREECQVL